MEPKTAKVTLDRTKSTPDVVWECDGKSGSFEIENFRRKSYAEIYFDIEERILAQVGCNIRLEINRV